MGFFCYKCGRKVRGQPAKHGCTRKKYGKNANRIIYDQSGNKSHRSPPGAKGLICFDLRDNGVCLRENCCYSHKGIIGLPECRDYVLYGRCNNFKKCRFSHPKDRRGVGHI